MMKLEGALIHEMGFELDNVIGPIFGEQFLLWDFDRSFWGYFRGP